MNIQPTNINEARRQANSFTRAQTMNAEGYTYRMAVNVAPIWDVYKPGNNPDMPTLPDYTVHLREQTCTCPDFLKHNKPCKHLMFVELELKKEEEASMEAQCREYDLRAKYEI